MSDDVKDVKSKLDIAEVIGDRVELRRRGSSLWGLCPFHQEKTPSFCVQPDRGTFHCFGCGKGGDVFTFVMEMEGLSFPDALRLLADRAGVELTGARARRSEPTSRSVRDVLEEACAFFRGELDGPGGGAARAYLGRRAIPPEVCAKFEIGWAPASWDAMMRRLSGAGVSAEAMLEAGLVSEGRPSPRGRSFYDRFRGRVMFPVRDEAGRLAGFGGRIIDGDGAKYVNSPEGSLFSKRRMLYLMHEAKRSARERGRVILTEGYMDAIRAHMCGYTETVASLGTSLTEEQTTLIRRYAQMCVIAYDGDGAGLEASIRGMYMLRRAGVDVRVAALPGGRDPDELLSSDGGTEAFERAIEGALPLPLFHARARADRLRSSGPEAIAARGEIIESLASLPSTEISSYMPAVARVFGVMQHELEGEIDARRRGARPRRDDPSDGAPAVREKYDELECAACGLLWKFAELRDLDPSAILPHLSSPEAVNIVSGLLSGDQPEELMSRWLVIGDRACTQMAARCEAVVANGGYKAEHMPKLVADLKTRTLRRRYEVLRAKALADDLTDAELDGFRELTRMLKGGVK